MKRIYAIFLFAFFIWGCGDNVSNVTETNINQVVSKLDAGQKFDKCTSQNFGDMVYAMDSSSIFFCDGESWIRMTMSFDKDTIVKLDSVYVFKNDSVPSFDTLENDYGCFLKSAKNDITMLICANDTIWFDKNESLKNYLRASAVVDSFVDPRDENVYKVVKLGKQTWMSENLNFMDTTLLPELSEESWCYGGDNGNCTLYGRLYSWNVSQNICPEGWHLPDNSEWKELVEYIMNFYGLDEWYEVVPYLISSASWKFYSFTSDIGFSSLPAGTKRYSDSTYYGIFEETNYWSSDATEENGSCLMIKPNSLVVQEHSKKYGFSVRCLKD